MGLRFECGGESTLHDFVDGFGAESFNLAVLDLVLSTYDHEKDPKPAGQ